MDTDRVMPPFDTDERASLESWLDFYRATLALKCEGLGGDGLREPAVAPSGLTLQGLVQHMAEVERNWFRRVLAEEPVATVYGEQAGPEGLDGGFDVGADVTFEQAYATWQEEIALGRANCAARALEDTSPFMESRVSLRWIYTHMIAEYARHCGHADLIRERVDGRTGI
jgi:hypothetical protein